MADKPIDFPELPGCSNADPIALQVLGDSMEPEFEDGCIIVIDPAGVVRNGSYVFADIDGEYIFRQLEIRDGRYFLKPLNPKYETQEIAGLQNIHGVIVQKAGRTGRRKDRKRYV